MAGEAIPMRLDIASDPKVCRMASVLDMDRYAVVGRLHAVWAWGNQHTYDGLVKQLEPATLIDPLVDCPGFALAMISVGWIEVLPGGFRFPDFKKWNSCAAKKRSAGKFRKGLSVYFIQAVGGGPIKIGLTDDPTGRLLSLSTAHPEPLRFLALIPEADSQRERELHKRFAHLRLRGEWFRAESELLEFIASIAGKDKG